MAEERPGARGGKPRRGAGATGSERRSGGPRGSQGGRGERGGQSGRRDERRDGSQRRGQGRPGQREDRARTDREPRTEAQAAYDGPPIPEHITGRELDRNIAAQLKGLPEKLAARVARHLVAAGELIDSDPETAYQHTVAARGRAGRLAVVREASGEAAYAAGHYAEALADLRAAKRMNGATAYLPIMADCHRALGRPEEALKLAKSPGVANFAPAPKAEMTIVEAGARRDRGDLAGALRTLERAPLQSPSREPWSIRLRYAYADTLLEAGRETEALEWFNRAEAIDADEITDAAARARELEDRQSE